jgi:hypothetical protein
LEGLSSLSLSLKQPNLLRRWSPTKGGMMIDSSHGKGVHIEDHVWFEDRWMVAS